MAHSKGNARWYAVRSLYRSEIRGHGSDRTLLEERVFLVRSKPETARSVAQKEARRRERSYKNADTVRWKLQQLLDISEILEERLKHGTEICSRFHLNSSPLATIKRLGYRPAKTLVR